MAEIKWIKLDTGIFDNRKIRQIEVLPDGDSIIVIWMKLLCLAGIINDAGQIYLTKDIPYTDQMLASQFCRPLQTVQLALKVFQQFGMVDIVDDVMMISSWEKYQNVDKMAEIREYNRIAKQKSREKKLAQSVNENVNDMSMTCQPCQGTDIDKDIDKDIESVKDKRKRFIPPTLGEAVSYFLSIGGTMKQADAYWDYYESKGWKVGTAPMKDWKAAARNWVRRDQQTARPTKASVDDVFAQVMEEINGGY